MIIFKVIAGIILIIFACIVVYVIINYIYIAICLMLETRLFKKICKCKKPDDFKVELSEETKKRLEEEKKKINVILSDLRFPDFTKIDWKLVKEEPWSGNHPYINITALHAERRDFDIDRWFKDETEWIKANPNAQFYNTKKWEEFKEEVMKKKEIRNVGFETTVMVPVDAKTNLASIDANELHILYMSRDNAKSNWTYYRNLSNKLNAESNKLNAENTNLKEVNEQVVEANEVISQENQKLKEENEQLKDKIINLKLMYNSVYGKSCYPCTCINANAFAKAAESLAEHLEAGKPTYNQLLEENEKLKRENHSFRRGQESLEAEVDELDKECDALVEEKEELQAELTNANEALKNELEYIKKIRLAELKEYHKQLDDFRDKIKELESKKQNDIAVVKAEMQDKIDSLKVNLDYHVKQENYFREQYHKYKELSEKVHNNNTELLNKMGDLQEQCNELEKGVRSWKAEADRAHIWLRKDRKEKESLEAEIANLNKIICKTEDFVDEVTAAKIKELEEELEKYKKQCNRLTNQKMNDLTDAEYKIRGMKIEIDNLNTRLNNVIKSRKEINDEYTAFRESIKEDESYYKLWKDLADKYCKLEDRYKVAVALGDKLLKQVTDLEKEKELASDSCEPSGTGCCFKEEY